MSTTVKLDTGRYRDGHGWTFANNYYGTYRWSVADALGSHRASAESLNAALLWAAEQRAKEQAARDALRAQQAAAEQAEFEKAAWRGAMTDLATDLAEVAGRFEYQPGDLWYETFDTDLDQVQDLLLRLRSLADSKVSPEKRADLGASRQPVEDVLPTAI